MQRLWLQVTKLGLLLQPEMTPLIFTRYHAEKTPFTSSVSAQTSASTIAAELATFVGSDRVDRLVFLARVGNGEPPRARSTRLPLERLIVPSPAAQPGQRT
jgi:hypothetical protein